MIRAEFLRFIDTLDQTQMTEDEWRLVNVINDHIDSIVPLGSAAGRRSKLILSFAYPDFDSLPAQPPQTFQQASAGERKICRLKYLAVGPFRGFGRTQDFDLSNPVVLLYGPNGSGKSSFCEALECALLGSVNDCSAKRIDADEYLKNARTGTFEPPRLTALYADGASEDVVANSEIYRFCFVEKNRIDDFSRIASFTPGQQERLIATLFGIDEFDSFVGNFNDSIESYLPLGSEAAGKLGEIETALTGHRQTVNNKAQTLKELHNQEDALARSYQEGAEYDDFVRAVGTTKDGAIKDTTDQLSQPLPTKTGATNAFVADAARSVRTTWKARSALQETRRARATEVSYRDLYNSVLALEPRSPNACPACDTPLSGNQSAVSNPYIKAKTGLEQLTELAEIERKIEESKQRLAVSASGLLTQLSNIELNLDENEGRSAHATALREAIDAGRADTAGPWWQVMFGLDDESVAEGWQYLCRCIERMEQHDEFATKEEGGKAALRLELSRLNTFREKIVERAAARANVEQNIREAEAALQNAERELAEARQNAVIETTSNGVRSRIVAAYSRLMSRLQQYRDALPATLLANLGQTVVTLYNAFNRNDPEGDLIAKINLPLKSGDRILFSYASAPQDYFDALHILSEGHIRCLGLAILLAKNLQTNCPLLIFDDPVNAIDDDHRAGIRLTLFEDRYFAAKQIILTCHGEEFTKDIQNLIGAADAATKCTGYTFLPHSGDRQIRVDAMATKNYILSARNKFDRNEFRASLTDARRGLEWAANTIWAKVLPPWGVTALSLKLRPNAKPELMNLVQSLVKEMNKSTFASPQKAKLVASLSAILGLNQHGREWDYLNKGTHEEEDRSEFDKGIVWTVVQALESLDVEISASRQS